MTRFSWIGHATIHRLLFFSLTMLLLTSSHAFSQDPFETNTSVGLFADPEGTIPCISVAQGEVGTIYIVATTDGQSSGGFAGAEFRVEITNPEGYIFSYNAPPVANIVLGSPFDLTADTSSDPVGLNVAFPNCQTVTGSAGDKISLGQIIVVNTTGGGPTELKVKRRSPPSNALIPYPELNLCDSPSYTATPMRACTSEETGEIIAAVARLNDPACDPVVSCAEDCDDVPRLQLTARRTPDVACVGDTIFFEAIAINSGTTNESITMFIDGVEESVVLEVAPGDSVVVSRKSFVEECFSWLPGFTFGAVARTATCALPVGREVGVHGKCSRNNCDDGSDGCASVFLASSQAIRAGDTFSVNVHVGEGVLRARNLFGMTGRIQFTRPDLVEFVEFTCLDETGSPMSLGPDAICFATANQVSGYVDFAVSQKRGTPGRFGNLHIGRAVFRFPESLGGGFCAEFKLADIRLVDPYGLPLCYEDRRWGSRVCSRSPCQVFPGDTNRDGTVNAQDLEAIAGFWGLEGPPRIDQRGCYWGWSAYSYDVDCWETYDAAWSDASGDGRVDVEDVLCVGVNWGATHATTSPSVQVPAGNASQRKQVYEQMLAYMNGMSDNSEGVTEARKALNDMIASIQIPGATALHQNIPNPFNPFTRIDFELLEPGQVHIEVFDVLGRHVRTLESGPRDAGRYFTTWDGTRDRGEEAASGIYYYRAQLGQESFSRKMVLAR